MTAVVISAVALVVSFVSWWAVDGLVGDARTMYAKLQADSAGRAESYRRLLEAEPFTVLPSPLPGWSLPEGGDNA